MHPKLIAIPKSVDLKLPDDFRMGEGTLIDGPAKPLSTVRYTIVWRIPAEWPWMRRPASA
jgi:hypothetical protein